ncbi:MAG: hypothetical protein HC845_14640 [Akkermansiaceae bacterium]|nr:hypothetical protein [Akkermansiaceae bacterium]
MSFSDLMSSGRGPGVLGMLMALLVLVGFGILFMYASDDMAKAPSRSIESVISEQKDNINHHTVHLEEQHKMLAKLPERIALEKVLSDKNEAIKMTQEKLTALKANLESVKSEIATGESKFLAYKDEYRAYARNQAKGQIMETLTTRNGTIYKNVNIREVTAIGIQIRHDEGHKRISFEELSDELIDHYQYDPSQKEQALKQEMETRAKHDAEVALANTKSSELQAQQQALNAEAEKKKFNDKL